MATAVVGKALSYVGDKLLAYFTDNLLKDWAATVELGDNVKALELELLSVRALLHPTVGKEIVDKDNLALKQLLEKLQDLGYDADDVLDEMDYFRIQDTLDGTFHAADQHAQGWAHNLALNVHHTAEATAGKLICLPASLSSSASRACCDTIIHAVGKCFPCSPLSPERYHTNEPTKLTFDRVGASNKMKRIVEEMKELRQRISEIITTLGSHWVTVPNSAQSHRISTSESIEPRLYGRDLMMNSIIDDIITGKYSSEVLTVIPIVGPGGIGKTTLAQHIYEKLQQHFDLRVWICVSLNFDVNKLIEEIQKYIPKVDNERIGTPGELIGQRLIKDRKLLLVLDDIWDCKNEDQWKQLLKPFEKSQERGNIILATSRLPEQAQMMTQKAGDLIHLHGLESEEFEKLLLDIVFGDDDQSREDHKLLFDIGSKIAGRLKGSPLAAKTVGRLLKTQLDLNHWTTVLESKEWAQSNDENDIMPALKLSFDYLPSHQLKQCFSYCALFPQDYKFKEEDLINFWIGQEVHSSCGENKTVEKILRDHLTKLVGYGFLERKEEKDGSTCYNIHDLLHELAREVSSHECLIIDSSQSQVRSLQALSSIRHLSINIEDTSVNDRLILKTCVEDFNTLLTRLKVEKLRSLMLFGEHHGCFVKAFGDLFKEAKALRLVFLSGASYDVNVLLHNFYHLIHLRYIRIESSLYDARFPNKISRFYHMMVLDAKHCDIKDLPRDISNLVKLRHILVQDDTIHSSIVDVGKLTSLQELRRFVVKQDDQGFELRQIGHLKELGGSLCIDNLENVQAVEEADEAKLMLMKSRIHELKLCWCIDRSTNDSTLEEHVLERLKPSSYLQKLSIIGHKGGSCPSWLCTDRSIKGLESLCLDGVAWKTYPPIGELWLDDDVPPKKISGNIHDKRFGNLKRLELLNLRWLKMWVIHAPCQLFPFLGALVIKGCSSLVELSFSHSAWCQQVKGAHANLFPRLSHLEISNCPRLLSFPPVPWTEACCSIEIKGIGSSCLNRLDCSNSEYLKIDGKGTPDNTLWNLLDFHNLTGLNTLHTGTCQPLPLHKLQMLASLRVLSISCSSNVFPFVEGDSHVNYQFPVKWLTINKWSASGMELTQLLTYFPELSNLWLWDCEKVTGLAVNVMGQRAAETAGTSSSANKVDRVQIEQHQQQVVLLPPQLQMLYIYGCPKLTLLSKPLDDNKGGGIQGLSSLQRLVVQDCPELLSSYSYSSSSISSCFPFPSSLEVLHLEGSHFERRFYMEALAPLSNLSSLTSLSINKCGGLRGQGLFSLLTQGRLTKLEVKFTPNFFADSEPSRVHEQDHPPFRSSKLQKLITDDMVGFIAMTIRCNLFPTLTKLDCWGPSAQDDDLKKILKSISVFYQNHFDWERLWSGTQSPTSQLPQEVECFTKDQEAVLFVNSLEKIMFNHCSSLQYLPARLHWLPNLKRLWIWNCEAIQILPEDTLPGSLQELEIDHCPKIRSLPKVCSPSSLQKIVIKNCLAIQMWPENALPSSLQELELYGCPEIQSLPKNRLPSSLQKLVIKFCAAIRSLPKVDDLPSSLRELDVRFGSEDLRRQCRRLINIIPIVRA